MTPPLLELSDVHKLFVTKKSLLGRPLTKVHAVNGVSLSVAEAETVGLVGESGSGKSTVGRLALRLLDADEGSIRYRGQDITDLKAGSMRPLRREMQMVFQDPYASLDPSMTIASSIAEPFIVHRAADRDDQIDRVVELLNDVGLGPDFVHRYPHELSGGQRQRVSIARALAISPSLVVCDEAVSALDTSTQAQVLNLLRSLRDSRGLAYLFIAHDLQVVYYMSDRIAVMYLGEIVEEGPADDVYHRPRHPYTEALLSAIPTVRSEARRDRIVLRGDPPDPLSPPTGCRFHPRCPYVFDRCRDEAPPLVKLDGRSGSVACHLHGSGPMLAGESVVTLSTSTTSKDLTV